MATFLHGESRRMYSWWWDSHISPKNSKWLQENLTDMDRNVKAMIKLIEEDADSFAKRAEMYYKKRPELMKMVEEFYRAYRALAERYDHATGALRQAHRTMTEAFPNQIPPILPDDSPSSVEIGPHTPEAPSPMRVLVDLDDSLAVSSHFHPRRSGVYTEDNDLFSSKKGLKQLKELFPSGERKVQKFLNFKEEGTVKEKEDLNDEIKRLQEEIAKLTTKNENLMSQMELESQRPRILEETVLKLESVKETALLQYKLSIERLSTLETDISNTRGELNKANDEMVVTLDSVEERCLAMEKANKSLQSELETQQSALETRVQELEELNTLIEGEQQNRLQAETALMSLEQVHTRSQEEAKLLVLEIQRGNEKLKDVELSNVGLEKKISELNEVIGNLHDDNKLCSVKINEMQDEMKLLKETKEKHEYELGISLEVNKDLQKELCCLKEDQQDLEVRYQGLTELMKVISEKNVLLENSLSDANVELEWLREKANALEASCETLFGEVSTHVVEKGVLACQMDIISQNFESFTENNILLEKSLSDTNAELENSRARCKDLGERCTSFCDQNSILLTEKSTLVSKVENLECKYSELQNQHSNLEREKDSMVQRVMELQCSLRTETQEHEALIISLSSQVASLHNQIYLLEEEIQKKVKDFEMEQEKVINFLFETFIMQRCLCDLKDSNASLFSECQNLLEASRYTENQISQLKEKELIQTIERASLLQRNDILSEGIHMLLEELNIGVKKDGITDEVLVQITLNEAKNLLISISNARDDNQQLQLKILNLESKYLTLQDHHNNLEREKYSAVHQVTELESSLSLQKQEHETLTLSFSSQLASSQNQIHLLLDEICVKDVRLEMEQQKIINAELENFVLQKCLCDMKEKNLILSAYCQNLLEALRYAENRVSQFEHSDLIQMKERSLLLEHCEVLSKGIHLLLEELNVDDKDGVTDEVLLQIILGEVKDLLISIGDARDGNYQLQLKVLSLESKYLTLQGHHNNLEREKDSTIHQVMKLENLLSAQKQEHEALTLSFLSQLASLQEQIHLLQEQIHTGDVELEKECQKTINADLENFVLQRCLCDMKNNNLTLSIECQNLLEALQLSEKCISQLEHMDLIQKNELTVLSNHCMVLRANIHEVLQVLKINSKNGIMDYSTDEVVLLSILGEISHLMSSILDANDENQCLCLELLVKDTLFKQIGLDKLRLHHELDSRTKELLALEREKHDLLDMNKQLKDDKNFFISQVLSLESKYLTLQGHHNNLEREKDSTIHQVVKLESSLSAQKQEHEALTLSFLSQLASLQKQIHLLQEEIHAGDVELEKERQKTINADLENFVLQRCLCDMKDNILTLSVECQNLLEALQHSEKCISQLEHMDLIQKNELTLLSDHCMVLRANIHEVLQVLKINSKNGIMDYSTDEVVLPSILGEISHLMSFISDANDENQRLCLELLVKDTLFKQIGLDKLRLHHELDSRTRKLLASEREKHDLLDRNKQLKDEKNFFISQVEILETKHTELEEEKLFLEREKDSAFHQVLELECSLKLEKQEHHALLSSSNSQLASLQTQLDLFKKERLVRENEFEIEQQNTMIVLLENFILQRCLHDMKDVNSFLSVECQKLEYEHLIQEKEMMLVSENNEKFRSGILLLLKKLNIIKECETIDETKDEVLLQALWSEIKTMMNSVSNSEDKMQHLHIEISVLVTLLKRIGLEKSHLYHELASQNQEFSSAQNKKDEALQVLTEQLSDMHVSLQRLQTENCTLLEEKVLLSERFSALMEKMDTLEGENNIVFTEALTLDHLFIFFKSLCVERGFKLKLLSNDIYNIIAVKNGLDEEIRVQNEGKRELEVENMNLMELAVLQEFDLNMAEIFCEEFNQQIEAAGKLLIQKKMEISDAQVENTELCTKVEGLKKDLDCARVIRKALEEELETLSSNIISKDEEITDILETNTLLCTEVDRLNCEVQAHKRREEFVSSELQKRSGEICKCEGEIQTLFNQTHISTVNAVIFEEKVLELIVECESLETFSMLLREILGEEFAFKNACIDDLKEKLEDLKGENGSLKDELNAYSSLLMSLFDGVACVEEHIFSLTQLLESRGDDILDTPTRSSHQPTEKERISDLQKLVAKIESLQKVIIDTKNLLKQERLDSNVKIESAMKEIEVLKHKEILLKEISKEVQTMKDIQLDQMSNSRINSSNTIRIGYAESDEQMLELWEETAERDDGIEVVEEVKSEHPSCELSIDKPNVSARINESPREWNKMVNEKLDSDAQTLSFIQRSLLEFKTKLEGWEKKKPDKWECGTLKIQLSEVEEAILQQVGINGKLKKEVEENYESPNERRQISEQAKKGSEKIEKLELELQKIEYIFLKFQEENENKKNAGVERKSSILLSEYIYGKKDGKGKRRSRICGCMRPKTKN